MSGSMNEEIEFVKFNPAPKGTSQYTDHKDAFVLSAAQLDHVGAQGAGSGAKFAPIYFQFKVTRVQASTFNKLVNANDKKVTSLEYTSQHKINGQRKDKMNVKYEGLTFTSAQIAPIAGEQDVMLTVAIEYRKRTGKVTDYDAKGNTKGSDNFNDDLDKGEFK